LDFDRCLSGTWPLRYGVHRTLPVLTIGSVDRRLSLCLNDLLPGSGSHRLNPKNNIKVNITKNTDGTYHANCMSSKAGVWHDATVTVGPPSPSHPEGSLTMANPADSGYITTFAQVLHAPPCSQLNWASNTWILEPYADMRPAPKPTPPAPPSPPVPLGVPHVQVRDVVFNDRASATSCRLRHAIVSWNCTIQSFCRILPAAF
jgi:hypothetical protein